MQDRNLFNTKVAYIVKYAMRWCRPDTKTRSTAHTFHDDNKITFIKKLHAVKYILRSSEITQPVMKFPVFLWKSKDPLYITAYQWTLSLASPI
jgi:hypothetical protein